jgi:hypothetical protein
MDLRTDEDTVNQEEVARRLEKAWDCFMHLPYGRYREVNYYSTRDHAREEPLALVEVKTRFKRSNDHGTSWLGVAKYEAMMKEHLRTGLPTFWVVWYKYDDVICWINILDVDPSDPHWRGREPRVGAPHDMEWMIDVSMGTMHAISEQP